MYLSICLEENDTETERSKRKRDSADGEQNSGAVS